MIFRGDSDSIETGGMSGRVYDIRRDSSEPPAWPRTSVWHEWWPLPATCQPVRPVSTPLPSMAVGHLSHETTCFIPANCMLTHCLSLSSCWAGALRFHHQTSPTSASSLLSSPFTNVEKSNLFSIIIYLYKTHRS